MAEGVIHNFRQFGVVGRRKETSPTSLTLHGDELMSGWLISAYVK